ncbi:hypothetical protein C8T65DRAFT_731118, partial [Cerioporus squamosus]
MDPTHCSVFAAFRDEEGSQNWHWDSDAQNEWYAADDSGWQDLCISWYKTTPEHPQTLSIPGLPLITPRILAREAYACITLRILEYRLQAPATGALIVGQSGSGKGCLMWYLLRILLMIDEPVIFACGPFCNLFYRGRAFAPRSSTLDLHYVPRHSKFKPIWLLADVGRNLGSTLPLEHPLVFTVKTSTSHLGHADHWATRRDAARIGIPLWSQQELIDA